MTIGLSVSPAGNECQSAAPPSDQGYGSHS
jgi:hypothetical protein